MIVSKTARVFLVTTTALTLAMQTGHAQTQAGVTGLTAPATTSKPAPNKAKSKIQAPTSSDGSETVVVTGLTRAQSLQKAPVSATVFTAKNIRDARIQTVNDFFALTPNATISTVQNAGTSFVSIQGLTQSRNGQPPVAVVVDGVQQMDYRDFTQDLSDIGQVEVLRGPQGDLYGRNALGGAIIINSPQPSDIQHGNLDLQGGNGGYGVVRLNALGPIIQDRLFYDVGFNEHHFNGLLKNTFLDEPSDYYNEISGHAHIKLIVDDNLSFDFRAGVDETHAGALDVWYQSTNLLPNSCFLNANNPFGGPLPDANVVRTSYCSNNLGVDDRDIRHASFSTTYRMPFATLTNVLAWEKTTEYFASDQDPYTASTDVDGLDGTQDQWFTDTSFEDELRLTSTSDWRIRWMVGGYFLDTRDFLSSTTMKDEGQGIARVSTAPMYNYAPNPTTSFFANSDHNEDFAVFGHLSYDILKNLTIEGGFRYDWDNLNQYVYPDSSGGVPAGCTFAAGATCRRSRWFPEGQPKVTLTYAVTPNINLYTDYGVGFRSGQFNQSGTAETVNLPGAYDVVQPEVAHTWEAGIKTQWLDRRLTVNASVFDTDDQNSFFFLFSAPVDAQILVNINDVRLVGGNLEINYTPIDNLDLFANFGTTHSDITSYSFDRADQGNWAPLVPRFNANFGEQYTFPLARGFKGFERGELLITGKEYWDPENTSARSEINLINLQAGIIAPHDRWRLIGWVKNLGNIRYNAEYDSYGFAYAAEPRTYGVDFSVHY